MGIQEFSVFIGGGVGWQSNKNLKLLELRKSSQPAHNEKRNQTPKQKLSAKSAGRRKKIGATHNN
jgi:hypothetical protein